MTCREAETLSFFPKGCDRQGVILRFRALISRSFAGGCAF